MKKKIKEKKIQNVIGEESDESDVKIKEKWFEKQNRKKMKQRWTKKVVKTRMIKEFGIWFWKKGKIKLMVTTTNCSTNHANLLVIVASHGSLVITNPWLQETIQSMANKMVHHIQTCVKSKLIQTLDHQTIRSKHEIRAVSYTHLTLPTIYSV